jgi:phosphoribosylamine--glycine ligase
MKILVIDSYGENALDWCLRCQRDGHDVRWAVPDTPRTKNIGKGLVTVVRDWREHMKWADLRFMTDNTKYVKEIDQWRARGFPVVGPNEAGAAWELDRDAGMKVLERAGIDTPSSREFTDYDAAIAYVKKEGRRFVSKPSGVEGDKSLSYVAKDAADLVFMLERWKKLGKLKGAFILQEFIGGCEMGVGAWFGPGGFNQGWEENFEFKPLMNDDKGPATGEQGTVMRFVKRSKLARLVLEPLADQLEEIGYVGCIDVNCIIDDKGKPWPLEFTMRPGWPAFNIQQALHKGDHAQWMLDLASGKDAHAFVMDTVAAGVVMSLPDYPYDHRNIDEVTGLPLRGVTPSILENVHPCMMMMANAPAMVGDKVVEAPTWCSAGTYVLVTTGTGETVKAARDQSYRVLKRLSMPGSPMWRTDIGSRLKRQLPEIQAHGYATGLSFST